MAERCLLILLFLAPLIAPGRAGRIIPVSDDIGIIKLSDNVYIHVSESEMAGFGMVSSNGVIVVDRGEAVMLDTPATAEQTETLVRWIADSLGTGVRSFVPNHWHGDCIGGLDYLHRIGVESFANSLTVELARKNGLPVPGHGFKKRKVLRAGAMKIVCYYPGGGHSIDNIVAWIPSERVLFAGCMVKDMQSGGLGNLSDADIAAWPVTIQNVINKFPSAEIVIPGHGRYGGKELLIHTRELLWK